MDGDWSAKCGESWKFCGAENGVKEMFRHGSRGKKREFSEKDSLQFCQKSVEKFVKTRLLEGKATICRLTII